MALNNLGLGFLFTAKDLASTAIKKLEGNFKGLDETTDKQKKGFKQAGKGIAAGMAMMAVGAGGLKASFNLAGSFGDFEQSLARVGFISSASEEDLARLGAAAKQAGIDTQFSPTEAVLGLQNLASVGFNADQSLAALNPSLGLAAGGMLSVEQSTATLSAALKAFGHDASEAGHVANQLLKITTMTSLRSDDLQLAIGTVARGASAASQSMTEMLPAMGLVKNTGVDVSVAASSVSSALLFMAKNAKGFKKIGVDVTDSSGNFRNFMDVILDFEKATAGMTNQAEKAALTTELFGRFGQTAANAIGGQLTNGITDSTGAMYKGAAAAEFMRKSMIDTGDVTGNAMSKINKGFKGQMTLLAGSAQTLAVTLGEPIAAALLPVIQGITKSLNWLIEKFTALPGPVKTAFALIMTFGSALLFIVGVIKVVGGAITILGLVFGGFFATLSAALSTMGAALLVAAPWLLLAAVIVGIGYLIYDNWEAISEALVDAFDWVVDKVSSAFGWLWGWMKKIGGALFGVLKWYVTTWFNTVKAIVGAVRSAFAAVADFIKWVWNGIISALTPVFDFVKGIMSAISDFIDTIVDKIEWLIDKAKDVGGVFKDIGGGIMDFGGGIGDLVSDAGGAIGIGGGGGTSSIIETIKQQQSVAAQTTKPDSLLLNAAGGKGKSATPVNLTINTNVDGEVVATTTKKFLADEKNRSFGNADAEDA